MIPYLFSISSSGDDVSTMSPGSVQLSTPARDTDHSKAAPVGDQGKSCPRPFPLEQPVNHPDEWISPVQAPSRPCPDDPGAYEDRANVESESE
jgi:hypothetical protein